MIDKGPVRIAVIDDDPVILNVFSSLLKQTGYHADFFSSSVPALKAILAYPACYHLVIVDIVMPEGDGISFAKKIRSHLPDLPIMFMTGGVQPEKREEALSLGRVAFLDKPFPLIEELQRHISKFLEER